MPDDQGYTKKEKDFWGNEKDVHYDKNGNKVGETTSRTDIWGDKVETHFDADGNKIGESRPEYRGAFRTDNTRHSDGNGRNVGRTTRDRDWFDTHLTTTNEGNTFRAGDFVKHQRESSGESHNNVSSSSITLSSDNHDNYNSVHDRDYGNGNYGSGSAYSGFSSQENIEKEKSGSKTFKIIFWIIAWIFGIWFGLGLLGILGDILNEAIRHHRWPFNS